MNESLYLCNQNKMEPSHHCKIGELSFCKPSQIPPSAEKLSSLPLEVETTQ